MNPVFATRRRAEEFHASVEGAPGSPRYADLLELVSALRAEPAPEARPEFVAELRSRLMLAAETALAPGRAEDEVARRAPAVRRTPRERRMAVAIGGFAIVSASASMAVAAQSALPGDTLYPLKRALEDVQTSVQRGADDKGATMLDNAAGRLTEVDELSRSDGPDPAVITQTLQDFAEQSTEASDVLLDDYARTRREASIEELRSFTADSLSTLEGLEAVVPVGARVSLADAVRTLGRIDRLAVRACPGCSDLAVAAGITPIGPATPFEELLDPLSTPSGPPTPDDPGSPPAPGPTQLPPVVTGAPPAPVETEAPGAPEPSDPPDPPDEDPVPELPEPGAQNGGGSGGNPLDDLGEELGAGLGGNGTNGAGNGSGGGGVVDDLLDVPGDAVDGLLGD